MWTRIGVATYWQICAEQDEKTFDSSYFATDEFALTVGLLPPEYGLHLALQQSDVEMAFWVGIPFETIQRIRQVTSATLVWKP